VSFCSLGLSATSQQYFSLRTNQPPATSQQYFSLRTNQHQPSATSRTNRLTSSSFGMTACESVDCHGGKVGRRGKSAPVYHLSEKVNFQPTKTHLNNFFIFPLSFPIKKMLEHFFKNVRTFFKENVESKFFHKKLNQHFLKKLHQHLYRQKMLNPTFFFKRFHQHFCDNVGQHF
jgi:hypothetical protein